MHYFILALSQKKVTLFEVNHSSISVRDLDDLPSSFDDARGNLEKQEASIQGHSSGAGQTTLHGHGSIKDAHGDDVEAFIKSVVHTMEPFLNEHHLPLILATVEHEYGLYKKYDKTGLLAEDYIHGNHDQTTKEELMEKAQPIAQIETDKHAAKYLEEYGNLMGTGRTSTDADAIMEAAQAGKVDMLFVAEGKVDNAKSIAEHTKEHRGKVYVISAEKMPESADIAAILRL